MNRIVLYTVILIFFLGCFKDFDHNDAAGSSYIRGRLFLYDTITKNANALPLANKTIRLFYETEVDTVNYLFSTSTDSAGYFVFYNLKKEEYKIFFDEKNDTTGVIYTARRFKVVPEIDSLELNANIDMAKSQGVIYTVIDSVSNTPVKNATVCVYNNTNFFQEGKCEGSLFTKNTDVNGNAYFFGIPQKTYKATAYITQNSVTYLGNNAVSTDTTVKQQIIKLQTKQLTETGYNILVTDSLGGPVPNAQLCFFTSSVLFNTDTCAGSNFQDRSDNTGYAKQTNVSPGKYYILADLKINDSLRLTGKGEINVVKNTIVADTIMVKFK